MFVSMRNSIRTIKYTCIEMLNKLSEERLIQNSYSASHYAVGSSANNVLHPKARKPFC